MDHSHQPTFYSTMKGADWASEASAYTDPNLEMQQYIRQSTSIENAYAPSVLVGNYNEERFDLKKVMKDIPLPSQYSHYFERTYAEAYNKFPLHSYPKELKLLKRRLPHTYSIHQPELDTENLKRYTNSWQTTQRASFLNPCLRLQPIIGEPEKIVFKCE